MSEKCLCFFLQINSIFRTKVFKMQVESGAVAPCNLWVLAARALLSCPGRRYKENGCYPNPKTIPHAYSVNRYIDIRISVG